MKEVDGLENMLIRIRPAAPPDFTARVVASAARNLRQRKRRQLIVAAAGVAMAAAIVLLANGVPFESSTTTRHPHTLGRSVLGANEPPTPASFAIGADGVIPTRPHLGSEATDILSNENPNWDAAWGAANPLTAPWRGSPTPEVTLVLFLDYQCPYCAIFEQTLTELLESYAGKLQIVVRQLPLPFHEHSALAAEAALAAYEQGRFWEMHALLLAQKEGLLGPSLERYAVTAGLNLEVFRAALRDGRCRDALAADADFANDLAITGTPTAIIVGGRQLERVDGAQDLETLAKAVKRALVRQ